MKIAAGIAFPDADQFMVSEVSASGTYQLSHLEAALQHVTDFRCAIDGGAHVGTWAKVMSGRFARVIAVEPSPDSFECLEWNMTQSGCTNVVRHRVALGMTSGFVTMTLDRQNEARKNTGARFTQVGGTIPVEKIDSWQLPDVGFIKLDVEGSEYVALQGAAETLARCRPIVLYEDKALWTRHFGLPKNAVSNLLTGLGYRHLARVSSDEVWGPT